jgi:hypothetical protein
MPDSNGDCWVIDIRTFSNLKLKDFEKNILLKFIIHTHIKIKETYLSVYGFSGVCEYYI